MFYKMLYWLYAKPLVETQPRMVCLSKFEEEEMVDLWGMFIALFVASSFFTGGMVGYYIAEYSDFDKLVTQLLTVIALIPVNLRITNWAAHVPYVPQAD